MATCDLREDHRMVEQRLFEVTPCNFCKPSLYLKRTTEGTNALEVVYHIYAKNVYASIRRICTHNCTHKRVQLCGEERKMKFEKPAKTADFRHYMMSEKRPIS